MATIRDLMMDFRPYCPGMPEPFVRRFLSGAMDEFFTRSETWHIAWPVVEGEGEDWDADAVGLQFSEFGYAGTNSTRNPDDEDNTGWMRVVKVTDLVYKLDDGTEKQIPFKNRERIARLDPAYQTTVGTCPQYWYNLSVHSDSPIIGIYPRVETTQVGVFFPTLVHSVKRQDMPETAELDAGAVNELTQMDYPDFLYYQFGHVIVSGALSRALMVPGKDWTDPKLAMLHRDLFEDGIVKAKSQAEAGFTNHTERQVTYGGY